MVNYLLVSLKDNEEIEEGSYESLEALREAAKQKMDLLYSQDDFWGEKYEDGELIEKISKETFDEDKYIEQSYFGKSETPLAKQSKPEELKAEEIKKSADDEETFDALSDPVMIKAVEETEEILSGPLVQKKKRTEQSEISMLLNALATERGTESKEVSEKITELKTLIKLLINAIDEAEFSSGKAAVEVLAKQCLDIATELTETK